MVGSKEQKMIEYKRLADVKNEIELDYIVSEWKDRFSRIPDEVENLIKLIKIRLTATECGISVVREASESIRIYTPFTPYEWNILKQNINREILKKIKFAPVPKSCVEGKSILLIDTDTMPFNEVFETLTNLFYSIKEVVNKYQNIV